MYIILSCAPYIPGLQVYLDKNLNWPMTATVHYWNGSKTVSHMMFCLGSLVLFCVLTIYDLWLPEKQLLFEYFRRFYFTLKSKTSSIRCCWGQFCWECSPLVFNFIKYAKSLSKGNVVSPFVIAIIRNVIALKNSNCYLHLSVDFSYIL